MSDSTQVTEIDIYGKQRQWSTSLYTNGLQMNPSLPHRKRLKIVKTKTTGDFQLQITNFSNNDEGLYICFYAYKNSSVSSVSFVLQKNKYPSNIIFINETNERMLTGIEYKTLRIKCSVESGKPPESLSLIRQNKTVKTGGHGNIEYTFIPTKLDNNNTYTCEARSPILKHPLRRNVRINIQYTPAVSVIGKPIKEISEGGKTNLCCYVDSNSASVSTRFLNGSRVIFVEHNHDNQNHICYTIEIVSRYDRGNYTCIADNEIGRESTTMSITVKYPPEVHLDYKNFTLKDKLRTIQCTAEGFPSNYTYGVWEHQSEFNEHIRYLKSTDNGTLILPRINEASSKYQDSGIYICMVSNGVPNKQHFQQGKAYVVSQGPPVFVKQNRPIQYGAPGEKMNLIVYILSYSKIECTIIKPLNILADANDTHDTYIRPLKVGDMFHGQNIKVNGIEMIFVLQRVVQNHYQTFRITVCNKFGNRSYTVHLILTDFLKQRYKKRMHSTNNDEIGGRNRDDSAHYIEINEENMLPMAIFQENNEPIISPDTRIVSVSQEHDLDFSNNDSATLDHAVESLENDNNALAYLDDGYERPYATLVTHTYGLDTHVYLTTETKSSNDNLNTSQNATYEHAFTSKEKDYPKDKQIPHATASDHQVDVLLNDLENNLSKTDHDFHLLSVDSETTATEYINLSLKQ
ncbi:cell adhesion molecule Dscam1-like [Mytilus edulis]|uniref:cell adhesion molecule Dscam1-like n=1 Tax=Mytilus edulis TaxID=6550 RepID=UPI0039F0C34D